MKWLTEIIEQLKTKTVWGIILWIIYGRLQEWFGLTPDQIDGLAKILMELLLLVAQLLTAVGVSDRVTKVFKKIAEALAKKTD